MVRNTRRTLKNVASAPELGARLRAPLTSRRRTQAFRRYFEDDDRP